MLKGQRPIRGCWSRGVGEGGKEKIHTPLFELWWGITGCYWAEEQQRRHLGDHGSEAAAVLELGGKASL